MIPPVRFSAKQQPRLGRSIRMSQHRGLLTPEERARITQLQDLLIDRFVEHREAPAAGQGGTRQDRGGGNRRSPGRKG